MATLWFALVAFMLAIYVILDGFDIGVGAIHPFAAKTDAERRMALRAVGPVWDGNEVWLLAAGGTLFFAFPALYASSFSGFYLPLMIVLWLLMLRGLAIELRSRMPSIVWRSFWDALFFLGSALLAVFFGAALGNVIRGVPLGSDGYFFEPLWTDFDASSASPGILDWYTILTGLLAMAALVTHGAVYLTMKTEHELNARSSHIARVVWPALVFLTALATVATFALHPRFFANFATYPWGLLIPLIAVVGLAGTGVCVFSLSATIGSAQRRVWLERSAFWSSCAYIGGMLASTAFAVYPNVLPAVDPRLSLTAQNAAASSYGLTVGLVWWLIGIFLATIYFVVIYRLFGGKVKLEGH